MQACFLKVFGVTFSGFGDARTLDFDDPIMVLKVFLKYRRSAFDVVLASQKSSKIGKNHIKIRKNRLLNRAEKTYVFLIDLFMKRAPKRHLVWLPKSVIKA